MSGARLLSLVALKDISSVYLVEDIVEARIIAISNDGLAKRLELSEVVDDLGAKEGLSIRDGGLVDDDLGTLGLDALHNALNSALAEVVRVALHRQAINTNDALLLAMGIPLAAGFVVAGLTQHLVGNEVLTGTIALYDGCHHVLRHVSIVGKELFGVLWQAVAAITKAGVVIVSTDTGVEAYTRGDGL